MGVREAEHRAPSVDVGVDVPRGAEALQALEHEPGGREAGEEGPGKEGKGSEGQRADSGRPV